MKVIDETVKKHNMTLFLYYVKCSENQCSGNIIVKYHECYQSSGEACHGKK